METFKEYINESNCPDKFMGYDLLVIDDDTFHSCYKGKKYGDRWINYVSDLSLKMRLQKYYYKKRDVVIQSEKTGCMVFFQRTL